MTDQEIDKAAPPPFILSSTVTVNFTAAQVVEIALHYLSDQGHTFDSETVKSAITKDGLTLIVESGVGKPVPATRKKRGPNKKPADKVEVQAPKEVAKAEDPVEDPAPASKAAGDNPFVATTASSNEEVISAVKAEAGVVDKAAFSTETAKIVNSGNSEAPAASNPFNFGED